MAVVQFSDVPVTLGGSSSTCDGGLGGEVEQPARKTAAAKIIPAHLDTRLFWGTKMRTQAVFAIYE